ncbi:serine/threonine-protein phosphatase 2A activator [Drosophila rhopaloa]|uniref:Serine/threonine-protein phosphatase 2A activator n=1 Tax=Drosophila rhopaloa TaxID=1041015 RepID=A0A6P4E6D7_DRORH|nr:serine/threonine-protein phosphatase 2A activator [Drosophila rhopaloa]
MMSDKLVYDVTDPTVLELRASAFMQNGPVKQVRSLEDLDRWVRSQAYHDAVAYISNTSRAIQGHRLSRDFPVSEQMRRLCEIFDGLEHLLVEHTPRAEESSTEVPTGQVKSQFYRIWMRDMFQHVFSKLNEAIRANCKHINELGQYLRRSFGNVTSLDFGPANELMFLFFLCGLFRAGILLAKDTVAAALLLFDRYIHLVRRLVATYALPIAKDPMCSIDDYYFLPYLWGAAQLSLEAPFTPMQCDLARVVEGHRQDYMMVDLIEHLQKTRGGQLSQVAFQLWSILSMPTWPQVYRGFERNYIDQVLCSTQTVQQAIFCELMSFESVLVPTQLERAYLGSQYLDRQRENNEEQGAQGQASLFEASPPVSRYVSLEPDSFLGFQEPGSEEKSDDSEGNRLWMLRQMVEENDPNSAQFFPSSHGQNESITSFANEGS